MEKKQDKMDKKKPFTNKDRRGLRRYWKSRITDKEEIELKKEDYGK